MTGNLKTISDSRIRYIVSKGPKYRFPSRIDLKVKYKGILFCEILMDCVARKRMQKTTSNYLKWFPRYCDLNFYMLSH